ncbi:amidohydrolase family protein [Pararhizobium sp. YC-54]|uniref:amidohydrolase family protein n=1 Tax=Pararhizobium sp. YC-54 TaxID=2986920 RepID=UPI0021F7459B|nr:amidohydrolase family protein [Pararhizobium sp. YC-54]MCV9999369.1 amidohydrolase family protein [Pararhizobium sp. YC-54]
MPALYISGGRLFDLDGDVDQPPLADVLIENGSIVAVGPGAERQALHRSDIQRLDASEMLLVPGLVNAHYHSHDVLLRGRFEQLPLDVWGLYSSPTNYDHGLSSDIHLRTLLGAADCLSNGVTTIQDMVTVANADRAHLEAIVDAYRASGVRVSLGLQIADRAPIDTVAYWDELDAGLRTRFSSAPGGVSELQQLIETSSKSISDKRLTWALAPSAPQRCSERLMSWVADQASGSGMQVFTHMYEARNQAVLARTKYDRGSFLDYLDRFGLLGPGLTIAHGIWIGPEELERFGAAGANFAFNPASNLKLLNGFAPIREYVDCGATIALGCDNCSGNDAQSVFQSMKMFALYWAMQSGAGETGAAREAFKAATIGGARALGLEGKIGRLKEGFQADLLLIDLAASNYRPLNSALNQLVYGETGQAIDSVIVAGEILVRRGELINHPSRDLKDAAEEARARLQPEWDRVAQRNSEVVPELLRAFNKAQQFPLPFDRFRMQPRCSCH